MTKFKMSREKVNIDLDYSCLREFHFSFTSKPKSLHRIDKIGYV